MSFMSWLWPSLDKRPAVTDAQEHEALVADINSIRETKWTPDVDAALEEARRIIDAENERRTGADKKATTYLAVVGALMPILASLAPKIGDTSKMTAERVVAGGLMLIAVAYLLAAGAWAFRTLRVSVNHRVDAPDLIGAWRRPRPKEKLVAELLITARYNWRPVNEKVSAIRVTHAFLVRAFSTFAILLFLQIAWPPAASPLSPSSPSAGKSTSKAPIAPVPKR